jgi:hypothetical protein
MVSDKNYKLVTVVLSIIVITLASINICLNLPIPSVEVGMFPSDQTAYSNAVIVRVLENGQSNENIPQVSNETSGEPYSVFNFSFQVYNSGKGSAYNVDVMAKEEPSENIRVISTYVFVGEPLESNLLDTVQDEYRIGLLGAGKSYVFLFVVEVLASYQGKFVLTVKSDNSATKTYELIFK